MRPTDRQLHQHLARALDPPDEELVGRWLLAHPSLSARVAASAPPEAPSWSLPPPGLDGGLFGRWRPAATMDRSRDGWIELLLEVPPGHEHDVIVVLERGSEWGVTFPGEQDEDILVSMLERAPSGQRKLNTVPTPGMVRLAVVLCPPALARHRDWDALRERLVAGALPVCTVSLGR